LFMAAERGHAAVIELLIARGATVGQRCQNGATAVFAASEQGRAVATKILLENGADAKQARDDGATPVYIAAQGGHAACLVLLIKAGADPHAPTVKGTQPVFIAAAAGHADALHVLLKAGADARAATGPTGAYALHIVCQWGHLDALRVLVEPLPLDRRPWYMFLMGGGAASELQDYLVPPANRTTRNFLPRLYSKPDMVKEVWTYLHKPRYADVDQLDGQGKTAAQVAMRTGHADVINAEVLRLLEHGVGDGVDSATGDGGGGS
jgi:ankyrin repeat protein